MKTQEVVDALKKLGWKISFAESCTGGLCSAEVISISGASNVIGESYVTYSNESKEKILKVKPETIKKFDVVSKEVNPEETNKESTQNSNNDQSRKMKRKH